MHRQSAKPVSKKQQRPGSTISKPKALTTSKKASISTRLPTQRSPSLKTRAQLLPTNTSLPHSKPVTPFSTPKRFFSAESQDRQARMHDTLNSALQPTYVDVKDVSGGCGAFYHVTVVSPQFEKKLTLHRHRAVQAVLKDIIPEMHGLNLFTYTPEQWTELQAKSQDAV